MFCVGLAELSADYCFGLLTLVYTLWQALLTADWPAWQPGQQHYSCMTVQQLAADKAGGPDKVAPLATQILPEHIIFNGLRVRMTIVSGRAEDVKVRGIQVQNVCFHSAQTGCGDRFGASVQQNIDCKALVEVLNTCWVEQGPKRPL